MAIEPHLSSSDIQELITQRQKGYDVLSPLEQYAMFMGKAQILEFNLKGLLLRRFGMEPDKIERKTLGQIKNILKERGVRPDFISLLGIVVEYRNEMAHEYLLNAAITESIANFSERKLHGILSKANYELDRIMIIYDWCEEYDGWGIDTTKMAP